MITVGTGRTSDFTYEIMTRFRRRALYSVRQNADDTHEFCTVEYIMSMAGEAASSESPLVSALPRPDRPRLGLALALGAIRKFGVGSFVVAL